MPVGRRFLDPADFHSLPRVSDRGGPGPGAEGAAADARPARPLHVVIPFDAALAIDGKTVSVHAAISVDPRPLAALALAALSCFVPGPGQKGG
jgi:hypothetical protein